MTCFASRRGCRRKPHVRPPAGGRASRRTPDGRQLSANEAGDVPSRLGAAPSGVGEGGSSSPRPVPAPASMFHDSLRATSVRLLPLSWPRPPAGTLWSGILVDSPPRSYFSPFGHIHPLESDVFMPLLKKPCAFEIIWGLQVSRETASPEPPHAGRAVGTLQSPRCSGDSACTDACPKRKHLLSYARPSSIHHSSRK